MIINPYLFNTNNDPYFASVGALLHMDGTDGSTSFLDVKGNVWTPSGNAKLSTTSPLYGISSGLFDGAGDYVSTPDAPWNNIATGDFTIEIAFNGPLTQDCALVSKRTSGTSGWVIEVRSTGAVWFRANIAGAWAEPRVGSASGIVPANTRVRIAVQRRVDTWQLFCEGTLVGSLTQAGALSNVGTSLKIGSANDAGEDWLKGKVDEFRMTKGIARYPSSGYVPASTLFPDH